MFVLYEGAVLWLIHKVPQVQNAHDYAVFVTMKGWPHGCKRVGLLLMCVRVLMYATIISVPYPSSRHTPQMK